MVSYKSCEIARILLVEDNRADQELTKRALAGKSFASDLAIVDDGAMALDYVYKRNGYEEAVVPDLILLDLNLPKISGSEFLKIIKNDPNLRHIPVIVLTTSASKDDIDKVYNAGGNSFVVKPVEFDSFTAVLGEIGLYWFQLVTLPRRESENITPQDEKNV